MTLLNLVAIASFAFVTSVTPGPNNLMLLASGHRIGPAFPLMLYFNQIVGSMVKIYVVFRLDRQSWTRQSTKLSHDHGVFQAWFNRWSTYAMTFSAVSVFVAVVLHMV